MKILSSSVVLLIAFTTSSLHAQTPIPTAHIDLNTLDRTRILTAADAYLTADPITVTASHSPRSTGGQHDFFSEGDYWWPDPQNPDGPYIQKDGMTNPDNFVEHRKALMRMSQIVPTLTAAWKLTGDTKYSDAAIQHLKAWFVDDATKMNPNLQYAQAIHGRFTGRGTGIIDTIHLIEPVRSAMLLEKAGLLKGDDLKTLKAWFTDYLHWLKTSDSSHEEMTAKNNHGTCWSMQVAEFSLFVGDTEQANWCRKNFKEVLLPGQEAPLNKSDTSPPGSFPKELARTKPYSYSNFNLDAMCTLCEILSTPADNLWEYSTPDGRNIRQAAAFMYPYLQDKQLWLKQPFVKGPDVMFWDNWPVRSPSLLFAGQAYNEQKYLDLWKTLPPDYSNEEVLRNVPIRTPIIWQN